MKILWVVQTQKLRCAKADFYVFDRLRNVFLAHAIKHMPNNFDVFKKMVFGNL